jgi:hypothetical protein
MNSADIITQVFKNTTYVEEPQVIISPDRRITEGIRGTVVNKYPPGFVPVLQPNMVSMNAAEVADMFIPGLKSPQLEAVLAKADSDRRATTTHRIDHMQKGDFDKYMDDYSESLTMAGIENKVEMMRRAGFSQDEAIAAIQKIRAESALKIAMKTAPYNNFDDVMKTIRAIS